MKEMFSSRAEENLKAAEALYELKYFNASANRSYFAVFHSSISYLFEKGLKPTISHKNVLSMFVNEFINKKKIFPFIFKDIIYRLQYYRNLADYKSGISKSKANTQIINANKVINAINKEIT